MKIENDFKGSYEARQWLKDYNHPCNRLPIVGTLLDFIIYRKICKTCTDEEVYELNKLIKKYDLNNALRMSINKIQQTLLCEISQKHQQVNNLCDDSILNKWKRESAQHEFEEEMEEIKYEADLTTEQLKKRNGLFPFNQGNIWTIPENILTSQRIIDHSTYKSIVSYKIYDKVYQCWSAKITAPYVTVDLIRRSTLADLKAAIRNTLETVYRESIKQEQKIINNTQLKIKQQKKIEKNAQKQVQKIRKILGQDNKNDNLNSPDIF